MTKDERFAWACNTPSDIAEHIPLLKEYALFCKSVSEFGVRAGVSTSAWLAAGLERLDCYDIAIPNCLEELKAIAKSTNCRFSFIQQDTALTVIQKTDLLFIDTLHTSKHLSVELAHNHKQSSKFIILHDTEVNGWVGENGEMGIRYALIDFLLLNPQWRIEKHYHNSNGLTILSRNQ